MKWRLWITIAAVLSAAACGGSEPVAVIERQTAAGDDLGVAEERLDVGGAAEVPCLFVCESASESLVRARAVVRNSAKTRLPKLALVN